MIDIVREIDAVQREVGSGRLAAGEARTIRLRRTYDAPIDDVWDALTDPERISRWFLPISGDYRVGGSFQFEGNAGGRIVACDQPNRLFVTWGFAEMGDAAMSELELRLTPEGNDATVFELVHTAIVPEDAWALFGPGAVGVGWDQGVLGLALHLRGGSVERLDGVAAVGRGALVRHPEQRGVGRRERRRRRRCGDRRPQRREHERVLRAGAGRAVLKR